MVIKPASLFSEMFYKTIRVVDTHETASAITLSDSIVCFSTTEVGKKLFKYSLT